MTCPVICPRIHHTLRHIGSGVSSNITLSGTPGPNSLTTETSSDSATGVRRLALSHGCLVPTPLSRAILAALH